MTTIPATPAVQVHLLPEMKDTRPEHPPMPDLWTIRYQEWGEDYRKNLVWHSRLLMFARLTAAEVEAEARQLITKGCRRVQIVKIGGDA